MTTGTTLYYPYIHPRSTAHLKAALLYWDRIRRIVPNSVTHGDYVQGDNDDCRILTERKLLISTRPEPYEDSAVSKFLRHIEPQSERFKLDHKTAHTLAQRNHGIHIEKIGGTALYKLQNLGLAHLFGEWVSMQPEVGAFYMFCLASDMAEKMGTPLFTETREDAAFGEALLFEPETVVDSSEVLVNLGIKMPSPEQMAEVPIKRVIKFAEKRGGEKQRFRAAINGIIEAARSSDDPNAIQDHLSSNRVVINEAVVGIRSTIDELHVGAVSTTAKLTVPAGVGAAIAAFPVSPEIAAVLAGIGLMIGVISCYAETRGKLRQARLTAPYHYLISVEKEFGVT
jgi:hypothetical protein